MGRGQIDLIKGSDKPFANDIVYFHEN
jgi:hypothetical protein